MKIRDFLVESKVSPELLNRFLRHCSDELELDALPKINLIDAKDFSVQNKSFGGYDPESKSITLSTSDRHPMDVFRTLAHELTHYKQDLLGMLDENSGDTGSPIENQANAMAGIIMRNFGRANPDIFG